MRLYRVFPFDPDAAANSPGGALFVPPGGRHRFDNPTLYRSFYCSCDPRAAIIERLGDFPLWEADDLLQPLESAGRVVPLAVGTYDADIEVVDLASVPQLAELHVQRVTEIVTRDRTATQILARRVFEQHHAARTGLSWWSFHEPTFTNAMLWRMTSVTPVGSPEILTLAHPLVVGSAQIARRIIAS